MVYLRQSTSPEAELFATNSLSFLSIPGVYLIREKNLWFDKVNGPCIMYMYLGLLGISFILYVLKMSSSTILQLCLNV